MYTVAVLVGSLRKDSLNKRLALAFAALCKDLFNFNPISIGDLPFYNQDIEDTPPQSVLLLRQNIAASDGVLFITPEYNRSLPAVLKNAVDWASRPYGKTCLSQKPAAVAGVSPGQTGACIAQTELRRILLMLNMRVLGQPEMFIGNGTELIAENGKVSNEQTGEFFLSFLKTFHSWIETTKR